MLNQQGFGVPQGNPNLLSPLQGAVEGFFEKKRKASGDLRRMVVGHELQSIRDERKQLHERGMQESRQSHALELQGRGLAHAAKEGGAKRRHETRMTKLQQSGAMDAARLGIAGDILKKNTTFEGIAQLGKGKRVSAFEADSSGGVKVSYNKPTRRRTTPRATGGTSQAPAPVSTPSRSTETPAPPAPTTSVAPVIRDPKTGRATRNPAYSSSTTSAPKAAPKAARKPRSK